MSTHTIGLLLAILGGFVPSVRTTLAQTFASTLLGKNLLAQTPAPSSLPEDRPTPEPTPAVKKPRVTQSSQWGLCGRQQNTSQRSSGFTGDTYAVPPYPASHGCMRLLTKDRGAEWIYDNTLAGITQVKVDGNPLAASLSPKCWSGDRLITRPTKK